MHIKSVKFIKGVRGTDDILGDATPKIVFIGRSNVGKSSVINSLTHQKNLARASSSPGRTREINLFLINEAFHLVDLPGYGFARASQKGRGQLQELIYWYLSNSDYKQKIVVFILDAYVGVTDIDLEVLHGVEEQNKDILVVANKIDRIKKSEYTKKLQELQIKVGNYKVIPYSSKTGVGIKELTNEILK